MHITRVAVCLIVLPKIYYLAAELLTTPLMLPFLKLRL